MTLSVHALVWTACRQRRAARAVRASESVDPTPLARALCGSARGDACDRQQNGSRERCVDASRVPPAGGACAPRFGRLPAPRSSAMSSLVMVTAISLSSRATSSPKVPSVRPAQPPERQRIPDRVEEPHHGRALSRRAHVCSMFQPSKSFMGAPDRKWSSARSASVDFGSCFGHPAMHTSRTCWCIVIR